MKTPTFITEIANRMEAFTGVTFEEICTGNRWLKAKATPTTSSEQPKNFAT